MTSYQVISPDHNKIDLYFESDTAFNEALSILSEGNIDEVDDRISKPFMIEAIHAYYEDKADNKPNTYRFQIKCKDLFTELMPYYNIPPDKEGQFINLKNEWEEFFNEHLNSVMISVAPNNVDQSGFMLHSNIKLL